MSKLINQGGYGCVYYPGFDAKDTTKIDDEIVVKLQHKSAASKNEIEVSKIILTIPHFSFYFAPILKTEPIHIGKIDQQLVKSCKPVANATSEAFELMSIPYVNQENYFKSIVNVDLNDTRHIFTQHIDSYTFLLTSLELLEKKQIVHLDIKDDNIVYNRVTKNPIIIDFGISIDMSNVNSSNWQKKFYVYAPEYYIWCMEIHFICYLCNEHDQLTEEDIHSICSDCISQCPIFKLFTEEFKTNYIEASIQHYMQFENMKKEKAIPLLLTHWRTWDNYSLCILNLRVLSYIFSNDYIENATISYLIELYMQNIHFDGSQRYDIEETKKKYKNVYSQDFNLTSVYNLLKDIQPKRTEVKQQIKEQRLVRSSISVN